MTRGPIAIVPPTEAKPSKLISVGAAYEQLATLAELPVCSTPFATLNTAIGFDGMLATQVYSVVAWTGRGKTSFISNVARHCAGERPVVIATWEMIPGYMVARSAAGVLGVHSNDIIRQKVRGLDVINALPTDLYFLHRPRLSELGDELDRLSQRAGKAPALVVDYLQKAADAVMAEQQRPDARLATSQTNAAIIEIAERVKCPALVVSATGRASGRRTLDPRAVEPYELVDVARESGAVEFDSAATIVLSLSKEQQGDERVGTITVAKARYGIECHIEARFHGARGEWRDLGRVEPREDLRELIRAALERPAPSATALAKRVKRQKQLVLSAIKAMIANDEISETAFGLSLPEGE